MCDELVFFAVRAGFRTELEKPEPCVGYKGEKLFCFLFSDLITAGLILDTALFCLRIGLRLRTSGREKTVLIIARHPSPP